MVVNKPLDPRIRISAHSGPTSAQHKEVNLSKDRLQNK